MTHDPSSYIIYCTKKYISQANARLRLWTPLPCNFPFTLLHGQLGQRNSWYARLDRTGWSSDAPLWIYSFGSETQQHVTMSHVNSLHSNSNPWIPPKKNCLHSQKKKVWIEISIQFQIFLRGSTSRFVLQQKITLGNFCDTQRKGGAPSTSRLRSAPPPAWVIAAFNSMDPPKKTNLHLQGTKGSQTIFLVKKLAASVCWTTSTERSGLQQGLWLSPGSGLIPGKVFGVWHGFITGKCGSALKSSPSRRQPWWRGIGFSQWMIYLKQDIKSWMRN